MQFARALLHAAVQLARAERAEPGTLPMPCADGDSFTVPDLLKRPPQPTPALVEAVQRAQPPQPTTRRPLPEGVAWEEDGSTLRSPSICAPGGREIIGTAYETGGWFAYRIGEEDSFKRGTAIPPTLADARMAVEDVLWADGVLVERGDERPMLSEWRDEDNGRLAERLAAEIRARRNAALLARTGARVRDSLPRDENPWPAGVDDEVPPDVGEAVDLVADAHHGISSPELRKAFRRALSDHPHYKRMVAMVGVLMRLAKGTRDDLAPARADIEAARERVDGLKWALKDDSVGRQL